MKNLRQIRTAPVLAQANNRPMTATTVMIWTLALTMGACCSWTTGSPAGFSPGP